MERTGESVARSGICLAIGEVVMCLVLYCQRKRVMVKCFGFNARKDDYDVMTEAIIGWMRRG